MMVQIELWHLISLVALLFGGIMTMGKLMLGQMDRRIDVVLRESREQREHWDREIKRVERQITDLTVLLPNEYVRREDWIRFSATIDSKMDGLHKKLDGLLERLHARG